MAWLFIKVRYPYAAGRFATTQKISDVGIKNTYGKIDSDVLKAADFYRHSLYIQLSSG